MDVTFPHGKQVKASFGGFTVLTDQPVPEGDGAAPTPFNTFLASIATCVGYYVLAYCEQHEVSPEKLRVTMQADRDPETRLVKDIVLKVHVPKDFPDKYEAGVIRAAGSCLVKRHMENPPKFSISVVKN